jgi:hypothetical protein
MPFCFPKFDLQSLENCEAIAVNCSGANLKIPLRCLAVRIDIHKETSMKLRNILIGCVIVLIIACIGGAAALYFGGKAVVDAFGPPITASNDFMAALIAKDYAKAYSMGAPALQADFGGSPDGMKQAFVDKGLEPTAWTFANIHITSDADVNGTGTFGGNMKYVYMTLHKDGDTWKIQHLQINDNAPTPTPAS